MGVLAWYSACLPVQNHDFATAMPDLPLPKRRVGVPKSTAIAAVPLHGALIDAELAVRHQAFLAAATSDNTRRTYRSAIRHFQAWGGALPADESTIIHYLMAYADSLNARTLALRLTALSQWHVYQGFADPASAEHDGAQRTGNQPAPRLVARAGAADHQCFAALTSMGGIPRPTPDRRLAARP